MRRLAIALGASLVLFPPAARAQGPRAPEASAASTEGVVVAVETDDLVLDFGATRGASSGEVVEIWRPLRLKHPVTGQVLIDRFLIGKLRLLQVRPNLSLAAPEGTLSRPALAGDIVVSATAKPAPPTPAPTTRPAAVVSGPSVDPDAVELSVLFDSLRGTDPATRIDAYQRFVASHPNGRFAEVLREEALALRNRFPARATRSETAAEPPKPTLTAAMQPIARVIAREPLRLAVIVRGDVSGVVLHIRNASSPTYLSQPMTRVGPEYWAATVAGENVQSPAFEYFVEAIGLQGTVAILGTAEDPRPADVEDVLPKPPPKVLGQAQIWTDYASFNAKAANDYIFQTEGLMGVRFGDVGIRAVRTGFGVYRGEGGTVYALDTLHQAPTSVGLTYGYLETELGMTKYVSLGLRGVVGLDNTGVNGGGFLFLRIGSDLGTNLWFGAEGLGGIGVRGVTQFEWNSFPRWPIVLRTEVTDEPAGDNVGVRAIAQVGYRVLPHLVVSLRGSYQGRTIEHSGPGAGAAVGYAW